MPVLSATECVSPAFRHTTQQMFTRFRFSFWLRMAVLAFFTGEISSGGFNGNIPSNFPSNRSGGHAGGSTSVPWHNGWFTPVHVLQIALVVAIVIVVVSLIFLYINSILRFVLFDAVLHGDPRLRAGWRKWNDAGHRFFAWQVVLMIVGWGLLLLCLGVPLAWLFASHHIGFWHIDALAIATLVVTFLLYLLLAIAMGIVMVLAKDFVVPIMALEGVGWQDGWRKFLDIARGHASEYVIYFLMKIVLRIASGIVMGIIGVIVLVCLLVPAAGLAIAGVAIGVGATTAVKALLITVGILAAIFFFLLIMAITALIGAPVAYFFPSYAVYFFAGRYELLGRIVFPPLPPRPAPPAPAMPEPPPMPA